MFFALLGALFGLLESEGLAVDVDDLGVVEEANDDTWIGCRAVGRAAARASSGNVAQRGRAAQRTINVTFLGQGAKCSQV